MTITAGIHSTTIEARFATPQAAADFVASFPKAAKLASPSLNGHTVVAAGGVETGIVKVHIRTAADGVNGGVNETGMKRLATIRRTAAKLGVEVRDEQGPPSMF